MKSQVFHCRKDWTQSSGNAEFRGLAALLLPSSLRASIPRMKTNKVIFVLVPLFTVVAFFAGYSVAAKAKVATYTPVSELKWAPLDPSAGAKGPQIAALWGDPNKGAHGSLLKLPAGMTSPMHTHTADYNAVEILGTSQHWGANESQATAKKLPPGSAWFIPGKMAHVSACVGNTDCLLFITQTKKLDVKVVEPARAPAKADAGKAPAAPAKADAGKAPAAPAKAAPATPATPARKTP